MTIEVEIKEKNIKLSVKKGKDIIAGAILADEHDLGMKLIPIIDKMLKKKQIRPEDIKKVRIYSDQSDSFTTTRIAKTFTNSWNWAFRYCQKR